MNRAAARRAATVVTLAAASVVALAGSQAAPADARPALAVAAVEPLSAEGFRSVRSYPDVAEPVRRGVIRMHEPPSVLYRTPSIQPTHSTSSTTCSQVTVGSPDALGRMPTHRSVAVSLFASSQSRSSSGEANQAMSWGVGVGTRQAYRRPGSVDGPRLCT